MHKDEILTEGARRPFASYAPFQLLLLTVVALAGLGSLTQGVRSALHNGEDFQWSGAHVLGQGVDPWKAYIEGDPTHPMILAQLPNYLHELYVMLLPLGRMPFEQARTIWLGANLIFLAVSLLLLVRLFRLNTYNSILLASLLLIGAPLRVAFSNGQQCLFVLCCFAIAYTVASQIARGLVLGVGFAKYTFAPILVMVDLLQLRLVSLVCVAVPIVAGLAIVWHITGTPLPLLLVEPIRSAKLSVSPGYGDIMTSTQMALAGTGWSDDRIFSIASDLGLLCAIVCAVWLARNKFSMRIELALIAVLTLACFKHVVYDFVFLVIPMAALLESNQTLLPAERDDSESFRLMRWVAWGAIFYLELLGTIKHKLHPAESLPFILSNMLALLLIAWVLFRLEEAKHEPATA